MYKITLENKKTKEVINYNDVADLNNGEKLFYKFQLNVSQLEDGEYTLSLYEDDNLILTDTLCVGDFSVSGLQYKKSEDIYIETKLESKTEDKQIAVFDIETIVTPSEGYDAMTSVTIIAKPVFADGYRKGQTVGYNEGYGAGQEEGYNRGKIDGYADGKVDGIEEGTSNAGAIIAETAQVLNITENGLYSTKYSKVEDFGREVTGYFDDGTPFYNYTQLNGKIFKTDIMLQRNSSVEIWWKPDFKFDGMYYGDGMFSTLDSSNDFSISFRTPSTGQQIQAQIGGEDKIVKHIVENKWYHFILKESGLVMDGETITSDFGGSYVSNKHLYINSYKYLGTVGSANGYYGMIKITTNDETYTIIPTENGFKNITTDTLLEVYQDGGYDFDGIRESDGNLIRSVNVNIIPKINIEQEQIKFAYFKGTNLPEWADWDNISDMSYMFYNCTNLIEVPLINTSNVTNLTYSFYNCSKLTTIPPLITSNVSNMSYLFYNCANITTIPPLNAGKLSTLSSFFSYSNMTKLTNFGGLIGLKIKWDDNYCLTKAPYLTYESCINVLNGLYDFTGNGETPTSSQGILKVHQNFLDLVGDELTIGTSKGWVITT